MNGQEVLVTGGAGFIGSHLVDRLAGEGFSVVVLDNLWTGHLDNIRAQLESSRVRFVKGDVRDYSTLRDLSEGMGAVFHLAGIANVSWSIQNPGATHEVNATGTLNVLRAGVEAGVAKVIFASSSAVYGNPLKLPIDEDHPVSPMSPYAASKAAAEGYARAFASSSGLSSICLRLFNVYGPRQAEGDSGGVIARFATMLAGGIPPVIYGDGEQRRDFVYVEDAVEGLMGAFRAEGGSGEAYNIGSGKAFSVNEVFTMLRHSLGKEGIQADYRPAQPGEIKESVADVKKAAELLGFKPAVSLEEGLRLTIQNVVARAGG
ncbi:MAG: SDR family NAD(P)-dependent oxidoreductase [Thaumarchaeota archaeon]|nr:SDR family NAD(P)-dependent oxidoreductase [Nitrososphaerota archaeon]